MKQFDKNMTSIKYLTPDNLWEKLNHFTQGMSVTKGEFELIIENCTMEDIEWNHMDQLHRPTIHNTYDKGIRIAAGNNFAVSLTQWGKWPFLITVSDVYVAKGLFYQSLTIAGIVFVHSIISMEAIGDNIKLKDEWYIASHKLFRFLHGFLNKKLYKLNKRLQIEDEPIRQGRFELRNKGYHFRTDCPDYHNSNLLVRSTIYPLLENEACFSLDDVTHIPSIKNIGTVEFVVKKDNDTYLIWPAACPHEGGPLIKGNFCDLKISCPWHGLQFSAVSLSKEQPHASRYGFEYRLRDNYIFVEQNTVADLQARMITESESVSA